MLSKLIFTAAVVKALAKKIVQGAGQKSSKKRTKKRGSKSPESEFMNVKSEDHAHSPGHRKMNMKETAKPTMAHAFPKATKSKRPTATLRSRRIITGAAVGKTGRIIER